MLKNEFIGKNSIENLKFLIKDYNFKKILIFTGKSSFLKSGANEQIKNVLKNVTYELIFKTQELPNIEELKIFIKKINQFLPDLIIAIGGGSVLDLAKMSNALYKTDKIKEKVENSTLKISNKFCKLVAIPTTGGSGAEVTSSAVLYINKKKYSVEDKLIVPDYVIIDPYLIMSNSKVIAASSGIDAIAQAIESIISKRSNGTSVEFAIKSLEYSTKFFVEHINKQNFNTSYKMCLAALYAGKAINISRTTAPHALSYPFTAYYGVKHGNAVSLTLTDFLKFNFNNISSAKVSFNLKERYTLIFQSFGVDSIVELEDKIKSMIDKVGLTIDLKRFNVTNKSDIDLILSNINSQRLSNNPVAVSINQIKQLLLSKI